MQSVFIIAFVRKLRYNYSNKISKFFFTGQIMKAPPNKMTKLHQQLKDCGRVLIAYSGGVDSSFLLGEARGTLGKENVLAVTAVSETYPAAELAQAKRIVRQLDVQHLVIKTAELRDRRFSANPEDRCFYCKDELFRKLTALARERRMVLLDATNYSDRHDYRPGRKAAEKWRVASPLLAARITKEEVRRYSRERGLPTWDQPAQACLASRIPYGTVITPENLKRVEAGELLLKKYFNGNLRLRHHDEVARIEVDRKKAALMVQTLQKNPTLVRRLKRLGWRFITVDIEGYRTGSLNAFPVAGKKGSR
jgi:uncharacterized protein